MTVLGAAFSLGLLSLLSVAEVEDEVVVEVEVVVGPDELFPLDEPAVVDELALAGEASVPAGLPALAELLTGAMVGESVTV